MCGPHLCSMKITDDVRKYAAEQGISEKVALEKGLKEKSAEWSRRESSDLAGKAARVAVERGRELPRYNGAVPGSGDIDRSEPDWHFPRESESVGNA